MKYPFLLLFNLIVFNLCAQNKIKTDLIIHHAQVYTVDKSFSKAEAFAIKEGKILDIGSNESILNQYEATESRDMQGKFIYPGFYDAHCHFVGYGFGLQSIDLTGTRSFSEIIQRIQEFEKKNPTQKWLSGRGWDQNDWEVKEFPQKDTLDKLFKEKYIFLERVDGHAALVNQNVLDLVGINTNTEIAGGSLIKSNGKLTGVLVDNAVSLAEKMIPKPGQAEYEKALLDAQKNCFEVGITTVCDAGLNKDVIEIIHQMHQANKLQMRVYAMVSAADPMSVKYYLEKGKFKTDYLNVRSFKIYADGALGSRGACLLQPYQDKPQEKGFLLSSPKKLDSLIALIASKDFQANTHCIGDSANRLLLDIYGKYLQKKNDRRWRIEHAQVVNPADMKKFADFSVIPSVQPTHCTSDMYWAGDRLGAERIKHAYTYKDLLKSGKILALGSDFPVEHINPLYGFYAAVARKDLKGFPENGFQIENAISREDALKGMTIWAAFSCFEEKERGSLEKGKMADFVVLEEDILKIEASKIPNLKINATYIGGKSVFNR